MIKGWFMATKWADLSIGAGHGVYEVAATTAQRRPRRRNVTGYGVDDREYPQLLGSGTLLGIIGDSRLGTLS